MRRVGQVASPKSKPHLLGGKREGVNGYFAQICEQYGYVGFAVDWLGMASEDNPTLVDASTTDLPSFDRVVDRQHQGFISWDHTEPDGYVPYIRQNMLPNTPAHEVLLHIAIGDHQVSPLGAHFIARTIGAKT